jgi:hypothetical protein
VRELRQPAVQPQPQQYRPGFCCAVRG